MADGGTVELSPEELEAVLAALRLYLEMEDDPETVAVVKALLTRLGGPPEYPERR